MGRASRIKSIYPKGENKLTELHSDIVGCQCSFMQVPVGNGFSLFITVPNSNSGTYRKVVTSGIQKYVDKQEYVAVETNNSVYLFENVM